MDGVKGATLEVNVHRIVLASLIFATTTAAASGLGTRWVRDSAEYGALTTQIYRSATKSVADRARALKKKRDWAVVLDVDETVLDNSAYQLERMAYGVPFDGESWNSWVRRESAPAIPGVKAFIDSVRAQGGRVVFLSNRHVVTQQHTENNLVAEGLHQDGDLICLSTDDKAYDKVARRTELRSGAGACSWEGTKMYVAAYLGDNIHDLPEDGEEQADAKRADELGTRFFVLPNPQYGSWTRRVTRPGLTGE